MTTEKNVKCMSKHMTNKITKGELLFLLLLFHKVIRT